MEALFSRIVQAHAAVRPQVRITPLDRSGGLSAMLGCDVWLKSEQVQPTGSFKIRGATNKICVLGESAKRTGVITASTGNHGKAVACAGAATGVPVTVYVSASTPAHKMEAIRAFGAKVVVIDGQPVDAEIQAREKSEEIGMPYVSPYNDFDVIAGQGTLGVELFEQAPDLDAVFISVGGGGLISGIGTALKRLNPAVRIVGIWPENSPCMLKALQAGGIIDVPESPTLSDSTAGAIEPGSVTFRVCQQVIDETCAVSEGEIAKAMRLIAEMEHWMVEGSAGVALAGLIQRAEAYKNRKVAVVLCGRNIALDTYLETIS